MTTVKETVIFNSQACDYDFEEMRKDYAECQEIDLEEVEDNDVWEHIYDSINLWYEDAYNYNLNKTLNGRVIAIADIGRWDGRHNGYKVLGYNLNSILDFFGCDDIKVYMDRHGVHSVSYHHDGRNYVDFRELREDKNIDLFLDKLYMGTATTNDIKNYTRSLRPHIKKIFG